MLPLPEHSIELTIERLGQLGEGVASWQGRTVFIPGAFPGDTVRVHLEHQGRVLRGLLRQVVEAGPARRPARCPVAGECGGCDWLELDEAAQRTAKQEIVLSTLEHLGHLSRESFTVRPLLVAPRDWGYRRRAVLHFAGKSALGYFGRRSHERIPVAECGALTPVLAALPGKLAPLLKPLAKDAEEVLLLAEGDAAAFAVNLTGPVTARHLEATEGAVRALRLEGAVLVPKEGSPRVVGRPSLRSFSPLRPEVPMFLRPDAFAQAHAEANVGLVASAVQELAAREGDHVLELYSGNGNFTFPVAGCAASVLGVETSPVGVEAAQRSAREGGVGNVRFVQGDARKVCDGLVSEGRRFDLCLADPPRTGAAGIAGWMTALGVRRVVYVACDPASLARDAAGLVAAGYRPVALQVVDMFPQTHHVEAVMSFER
ncbi:class I SAM-dependent RNA methyltransferase [Corallococcus sp. H22C18031201]|uniref:class I SAM-dependent RNA methyltransferase n=1 Tax=Citreicoccus inhibens TaxID=2849499 RepID=UPI000E74684A|nr:class I SAM-dependent RNA methyltransferase [Citreicoccus inhibens]MBU8894734.1 class I SAM-dependent RNA methyltransferase [Citreicoccus inhibens]RJS25307.1 class I SAM-dependent RNA methyltransferase [Corallococcus sp. H22C18031201]